MKALLLTLVLGLVCAQDLVSDELCSKLSGRWNTIYLGSNDMEAIAENEPMRCFFRNVQCQQGGAEIVVDLYSKEDGECIKHHKTGKLIAPNVYYTDYAGEVKFSVLYVSDDFIAMVGTNKNEDGREAKVIGAFGKEKDISEADHNRFLVLAELQGIRKENTMKVVDFDTCPSSF